MIKLWFYIPTEDAKFRQSTRRGTLKIRDSQHQNEAQTTVKKNQTYPN